MKKIRKAYHVTAKNNIKKIMMNGLIPAIGERSKKAKESRATIYLFPSEDELNDALMGWLGDEFGEDEELSVLEVDISGIEYKKEGWEIRIYSIIPPNKITITNIMI